MPPEKPPEKPARDSLPFVLLLPNLITTLGLCAGLTSIRFVLVGQYRMAAALILFAALIDGLDGLLARRLKATSDFGSELDSLSDFLSFGVAPALLVFQFALTGATDIGWIFVLLYSTCCCMRLARFNVAKNAVLEGGLKLKTHFTGVPAPAGAMLALFPVFLTQAGVWQAPDWPIVTALYLGLVGAAMISKIPTFSPKAMRIPKERAILVLIASAVVVGVMLTRFWLSLILIDLVYGAMLLRSAIVHFKRKRG